MTATVTDVQVRVVTMDKPPDVNVILGQAHFIKTVDDLHETLVGAIPRIRFGVAFCEASGARLIRSSGNDEPLVRLATEAMVAIAAGHAFVVFLADAFPVNVLNAIKMVPEVCRIYAATANRLEVVVAQTDLGRGILGVIDGEVPLGTETSADVAARRDLLRTLGYKLG